MKKLFLILGILFILSPACELDEVLDPLIKEGVTTVVFRGTNLDDVNDSFVYSWTDVDGSGIAAPEADEIVLAGNSTYIVTVEFWDISDNQNAVDLTESITELATDHMVIYNPNGADLTVATTDLDTNGDVLGMDATFTTGSTGSGTLGVKLWHEIDKSMAGSGSVELDATFDVTVQ